MPQNSTFLAHGENCRSGIQLDGLGTKGSIPFRCCLLCNLYTNARKAQSMVFYFVTFYEADGADRMCEFYGTKAEAEKAIKEYDGDIEKVTPKTKDEFLNQMNTAAHMW